MWCYDQIRVGNGNNMLVMLLFLQTLLPFKSQIYFIFLPLPRIYSLFQNFVLTMVVILNFIPTIFWSRILGWGTSSPTASSIMVSTVFLLPCCCPPHQLISMKDSSMIIGIVNWGILPPLLSLAYYINIVCLLFLVKLLLSILNV